MNSFDSYLLAANCAQFPLPILTGIGHERDDTVVDLVAHTRLKTPTAVAAFLIERMDQAALALENVRQAVVRIASERMRTEKQTLQRYTSRIPLVVGQHLERNRALLQQLGGRLPSLAQGFVHRKQLAVDRFTLQLRSAATNRLNEKQRFLQLQEQFVRLASPDYILRRGYSLTLRKGQIVKRAEELRPGERLTTRFMDGEVQSVVEEKRAEKRRMR